jgi:ferredoxin-NADP reductase
MEGTAVRGRLTWRIAELVAEKQETPRAKTLVFNVPGWPGHLAGQHIDIRLTAEDGYQTERSYSIASAPDGDLIEITVERLDDGEVSPYLDDVLRVGDKLELRGPIGGHLVWDVTDGGPLLLIAGGSGVAPLMAMIRRRAQMASAIPTRLLYSARGLDDLFYRDELRRRAEIEPNLEIVLTLTRSQPASWRGLARRIDREMVADIAWPASERPLCYLCGPTSFVEATARFLTDLGHDPERIKTERFGPTG